MRAETAGLCLGEVLALQKLYSLIGNCGRQQRIYSLGPLVRQAEIQRIYGSIELVAAISPEGIPAGSTAVIGAHGVPKEMQEDLVWRGISIVDATCPKMRKAQLLIEQQAMAGRMLLLYGREGHPDVKGLLSYALAGSFLFDGKEKLAGFHFVKSRQYCLAAQTTQDQEIFNDIVMELSSRHQHFKVLQTICDAARLRQEEAVRLAREVELMVVVGGRYSGKTRRLAQIVAALNTPVLCVEAAGDLPLPEIRRYSRVGLTAGASTPVNVIDEVYALLASLGPGIDFAADQL